MKNYQLRAFTGIFGLFAGIIIVLAFILPGSAWSEEKVKLTICHLGTATNPIVKMIMMPMVKELEATGKVKVIMYGTGSAYGNPTKLLKQVEKGIMDMGFGLTELVGGRFPLNLLMQEPFMAKNHLTATRAYMKVFLKNKHVAGEWPRAIKVMQVFASGANQLHTRVPVEKFEDISGKRIITTIKPFNTIIKELGGSTAALPVTAVYENLQKGVVDGYLGAWASTAAFRTSEITTHHIGLNLTVPLGYNIINRKKYEGLSPDIKAVIDRWSTIEAAEKVINAWTVFGGKSLDGLRKSGHVVRIASQEERESLKKRFQHVTDDHIKKLEAKGLPAGEVYKAFTKAIKEDESAIK